VTNVVLRASGNILVAPYRVLNVLLHCEKGHNGRHVRELQISKQNKKIKRFLEEPAIPVCLSNSSNLAHFYAFVT